MQTIIVHHCIQQCIAKPIERNIRVRGGIQTFEKGKIRAPFFSVCVHYKFRS